MYNTLRNCQNMFQNSFPAFLDSELVISIHVYYIVEN
jgi:hypothetical protein